MAEPPPRRGRGARHRTRTQQPDPSRSHGNHRLLPYQRRRAQDQLRCLDPPSTHCLTHQRNQRRKGRLARQKDRVTETMVGVHRSGGGLAGDYYRRVVGPLLAARWPRLPHAAAGHVSGLAGRDRAVVESFSDRPFAGVRASVSQSVVVASHESRVTSHGGSGTSSCFASGRFTAGPSTATGTFDIAMTPDRRRSQGWSADSTSPGPSTVISTPLGLV